MHWTNRCQADLVRIEGCLDDVHRSSAGVPALRRLGLRSLSLPSHAAANQGLLPMWQRVEREGYGPLLRVELPKVLGSDNWQGS